MKKTHARPNSYRTLFGVISVICTLGLSPQLSAQTATYTAYGSGCVGSTGTVPVLVNDNGSLPRIGKIFIQRLDLYTGTPLPLLGVSNTAWNGLALPFDLSVIGMPGCQMLTSGDAQLRVLAIGSATLVAITIPNDPALLGKTFYCQSVFTDVLANPFGVVLSNAVAATIGQ